MSANLENQEFPILAVHGAGVRICKQNLDNAAKLGWLETLHYMQAEALGLYLFIRVFLYLTQANLQTIKFTKNQQVIKKTQVFQKVEGGSTLCPNFSCCLISLQW